MSIGDRIKTIRGGESQEDFSKKAGVSKMTVGRWERGERTPGYDDLIKIIEAYPAISPQWLLTGDGPMLRDDAGGAGKQEHGLGDNKGFSADYKNESGLDADPSSRMIRLVRDLSFSKRLQEALGEKPISHLAKNCGISESSIKKYLSGESSPGMGVLSSISKETGYSMEWLASGEGPMLRTDAETACFHADECLSGDFLLVPHYNVSASAGGGAIIESEQIVDHLAFKRKWIRDMGLQADRLALINAIGDSMRPTIQEGNLLLVDLNQLHVQDGAIYILMMDSTLIAKRLQRNIDGGIIVKSDNKDYSDLFVGPKDLGQLNIVGRVVWAGRKM